MLSSTVLYGAADALVLLVGGFLLLPLYTRTLSQAEFGQYVVIRTGIELLTYLLHFGLLSAVARLYFDHRTAGTRHEYLSSIVMIFLVLLAGWAALLAGAGDWAWQAVVPGAPAQPYLWFSVAIAVTGFFGTLASTWLRLDDRAGAYVGLQIASAVALTVTAFVNLSVLSLGLPGLLVALLVGPAVCAAILPWLFHGGFRPRLRVAHARSTLHYALPAVASLVSYFVLNRISIVILQRHAALDQVAVFGLAQQLALLIGLTGVAFGKALQPAVFGAEPAAAAALQQHFGRMLGTSAHRRDTAAHAVRGGTAHRGRSGAGHGTAHDLLLVLAVATFAYSLNLLADTALLHQRRPRVSAALTLLGAALSTLLGLLLIPRYTVYGAACAMGVAFVTMMLAGQVAAARLTGQAFLRMSLPALALVFGVAGFAAWLHHSVPPAAALAFKTVVAGLLLAGLYRWYAKGSSAGMRAP